MTIYNKLRHIYHITKEKNYLLRNVIKTTSNYKDSAISFINQKKFYSKTSYLIWVDTSNFKTNIFKKSNNTWNLVHSYLCTIGKPTDPTIKGTFYMGAKGYSFGEARGFRCLYYSQIKGNYLFHSIPYNLDGTIRDSRLGMMLTDGCVRLSTSNAKWIYYNIPSGTTIFIS